MKRTRVNPWPWSLAMGFTQGEVMEGVARTLYCAGQTSMMPRARRSTLATWALR